MNSIIFIGAKIKLFWPIEKKWSNGIITNIYDNGGMCAVKFDDDSISESVTFNLNKYKYCIMENNKNEEITLLDDVYEVEAVTEKYFNENGKPLYKVKWKGYSHEESTWEPIEHLQSAIRLVQVFEDNLFWKLKREKHTEINKPLSKKKHSIEKYRWLLDLHDILSNPETQSILRWINDQNFEVSDLQTFTKNIMPNISKLLETKIYFLNLENCDFVQMPLGINLRFSNPRFIHSSIQFLYNIDLTVSHILFYQNRFLKFRSNRVYSIPYKRQYRGLELETYSGIEEVKYWPCFLEGRLLDINNCHNWSEYEVCNWLDCFDWGLKYKEVFYENAVDGRLLLEVTYPILFQELNIVNPIHQKQLKVAIDALKRARPIILL